MRIILLVKNLSLEKGSSYHGEFPPTPQVGWTPSEQSLSQASAVSPNLGSHKIYLSNQDTLGSERGH